jgi:predicted transcriptional regulator
MNRKLNKKQIKNLKIILKFRYITSNNLAQYLGITNNSAYSTLEILHTNGYLEKIHDKSYRLLNKSARYYLTLKSLNYLQKEAMVPLNDAIWKSRRSDGKKSTDFIDLQVAIHAAYNELETHLGKDFNIRTAPEQYNIEGIIRPLPGLLAEPKLGKQFFVEITDGQHLFLIKKRIRKYIQNHEAGEWGGEQYPDVYIVRSISPSDRTRLRKYIEQQMDNSYLDENNFTFHIISKVSQIKLT